MSRMLSCKRCGATKPEEEFHINRARARGRDYNCRECSTAHQRELRSRPEAKPGLFRTKQKWYARGGRERVNEHMRQKRESGYVRQYAPGQREAHYKVQHALRMGTLLRQPCERCGKPKTVAHHNDYSKPLEVNWLCYSCHSYEHLKTLHQEVQHG